MIALNRLFLAFRFQIRLMKEGRMKGQAFVTFPTDRAAERALDQTHGFVLHDRPMITVIRLFFVLSFLSSSVIVHAADSYVVAKLSYFPANLFSLKE